MKKSFIVAGISLTSFFVLTSLASAQVTTATQQATAGITSLRDIIDTLTTTLVKSLGTLAMAAGVVAFFYGIVEYIWGQRQGEAKKVENGRQFMLWGLIALFVMFSVYGFIKFGQDLFFKGVDVTTIKIPEINFKQGGVSSQTGAPSPTPSNPFGVAPGLSQQSNGLFLCPDGVTTVDTAADYNKCPTVSTEYRCPDGTRYYNASDAKYCNSASSGSGATAPTESATYQCPDGSMVNPSDARFCPPASTPTPADVTPAPSESANGCAYDEFGNEICN